MKSYINYDLGLSIGTIFSDFERPLTQTSRARHYSTFNISNIANTVLYVRPSTLMGRNVRLSNLLISSCCHLI